MKPIGKSGMKRADDLSQLRLDFFFKIHLLGGVHSIKEENRILFGRVSI